ncbi:MAG: serpin family protein, partial [Planctomycetota bacterium]
MNAIAFKGKWGSAFEPDRTEDHPFALVTGESVDAPLMHQLAPMGYAQVDGAELLEMAYQGGLVSMVVLLPEKGL